ncbi:TetR/AcrR family transcriptional regulator [Streptomyces sp. NPDC050095]|uniref:TetR/AcrR family transcriptional regulator n=1 Tax=unclassified Streptomyces TaxID=2593676 RepID=UPI0034220CE2
MTGSPNPDRRSQRSRQAILDASLELCGEIGYGRLTIEGIAARAGVSKKTIYRWWPSRASVVVEALNEAIDPALTHPDTGDLAEDMHRQITALIDLLTPPERSPLSALIAEGLQHPDVADEVRDRLVQPRIDSFNARIQKAQQRGELPPGTDPAVALDLFYGPIYHRTVLRLGIPDPTELRVLVRHAIRALTCPDPDAQDEVASGR